MSEGEGESIIRQGRIAQVSEFHYQTSKPDVRRLQSEGVAAFRVHRACVFWGVLGGVGRASNPARPRDKMFESQKESVLHEYVAVS